MRNLKREYADFKKVTQAKTNGANVHSINNLLQVLYGAAHVNDREEFDIVKSEIERVLKGHRSRLRTPSRPNRKAWKHGQEKKQESAHLDTAEEIIDLFIEQKRLSVV